MTIKVNPACLAQGKLLSGTKNIPPNNSNTKHTFPNIRVFYFLIEESGHLVFAVHEDEATMLADPL